MFNLPRRCGFGGVLYIYIYILYVLNMLDEIKYHHILYIFSHMA